MKVTATTCLGGKRHTWQVLATHGESAREDRFETCWCPKCGCSTEFTYTMRRQGFPVRWIRTRCREDDGSFTVNIPACHKTKAEIHAEALARLREERQLIRECEDSPG